MEQPLVSEDPNKEETQEKICWIFPIKCLVALVLLFLLIDFLIELFTLAFIAHNPHYDWFYPLVYGLCLCPVFAALLFF